MPHLLAIKLVAVLGVTSFVSASIWTMVTVPSESNPDVRIQIGGFALVFAVSTIAGMAIWNRFANRLFKLTRLSRILSRVSQILFWTIIAGEIAGFLHVFLTFGEFSFAGAVAAYFLNQVVGFGLIFSLVPFWVVCSIPSFVLSVLAFHEASLYRSTLQ